LPPDSAELRSEILFSVLDGGPDIQYFPALFELWPPTNGVPREKLIPLEKLASFSPAGAVAASTAVARSGLRVEELVFVPLLGRVKVGTAILDAKTLHVVFASDAEPPH
jgi:hypothetical protein